MKTKHDIINHKAIILTPPYEGWHPAGLVCPTHSHMEFLQIEGADFSEPIKGGRVTLNGEVLSVEKGEVLFRDSDGSAEHTAVLNPLEACNILTII